MTKIALAKQVDLTPRAISQYESGNRVPSSTSLGKISKALDFPESFFSLGAVARPATENVAFRSLSRMPASARNAVLSASAIALEASTWIDERFNLPPVNVPDLIKPEQTPEAAADALRSQWGQGYKPIKNLLHLLEFHGVRVFSIAEADESVDAFSLWQNGVPFIFLTTSKSAERSRFDCAHELGHLVLHRHGDSQGRPAEQAADAFASAFLMPRSGLRAQARQGMGMLGLMKLKSYWGVSLAALVYRLHKIGYLTEWHYRQHMIEISKRGWRKTEPHGMDRERSQVLEKAFNLLRGEGVTTADVARQLHISPRDLHELVFGLAPVVIHSSASVSFSDTPPPMLKLLK